MLPKTQIFQTVRKLPPRNPKIPKQEGPRRITQTPVFQITAGTLLGSVLGTSLRISFDYVCEWSHDVRKKFRESKEE